MPQSKAHNEKAKHITRKSCPRIPKGGRLKAELKSHKQGRFASSLKEHEPVSFVFRGKLLLNSENTSGLRLECKDLEEPSKAIKLSERARKTRSNHWGHLCEATMQDVINQFQVVAHEKGEKGIRILTPEREN